MGNVNALMITRSSISIAGFAAATSLGYTLESTLAAMGAGLSNFTDTGVPNEFGHAALAASLLDPDAPRTHRLSALFRHGLEDAHQLLSRPGLTHIPLFVGLPSDLSRSEQEVVRSAVQADVSIVGDATWFPQGRASTFAALDAAMDVIGNGLARYALVVGLDSLCAPAQVYSLVQAGRVLSPLTEGTIPGEAAAFALLARTDDPIVDPRMSVRIEAIELERAATPFTDTRVVSADGLTSAFRALRYRGAARVHRIVAAHSGEGYFGRSFAHAYLREVEVMPEPLSVELTSDRVGDVGAAAGIVGLAFSVYLMVQDAREGQSRALIYSESDTGQVGVAIVDGAPTVWQRSAILQAADRKDSHGNAR